MPEFRFHHLERRRLDQALPDLLEAALADGERVVLQATSPEQTEALNEQLWTYGEASFLPHGSKRDGDPEAQPIYLTDGEENPNGATTRALMPGVDASRFIGTAYQRILILIDGRDEEAKAESRRQWTRIKAAGAPLGYWREGENGGWEKAR